MRTLMIAALCMAALISLFGRSEQPVEKIDAVKALIEANADVVPAPKRSGVSVTVKKMRHSDITLLEEIVANEMSRLDLQGHNFLEVQVRFLRFLVFVKQVESNGERYAKAATSSAMSFFQFTKGSVPTAVNRLENYMKRYHLGPLPKWAKELRANPLSLYDVSELRQATLTLVNIAEQRGSDGPLKELLSGEHEVAKAIYYAHHHTAPDGATLRRSEKIFARVFQ